MHLYASKSAFYYVPSSFFNSYIRLLQPATAAILRRLLQTFKIEGNCNCVFSQRHPILTVLLMQNRIKKGSRLTVSFEVAQFLRNGFGNISRTFVWRPGKSRTELLSSRRASLGSCCGRHRTRTRACVRTNNHASRGYRNRGRLQGGGKSEGGAQHCILLLLLLMMLLLLLLLLLSSGSSGGRRGKVMGMMQPGPARHCGLGYARHCSVGSARSGKGRARGQGYTRRSWGHGVEQRCARPIIAETIEKRTLDTHQIDYRHRHYKKALWTLLWLDSIEGSQNAYFSARAMTNSRVPLGFFLPRKAQRAASEALEKWSLSTRMAPREMTTIACPQSIPIS